MADSEMKKRTLRCTDEEWQHILNAAERANLSASRYIVSRVCSEESGVAFPPEVRDDIRRILNGVRLLAYHHKDHLYDTLGVDQAQAHLERAKGQYSKIE